MRYYGKDEAIGYKDTVDENSNPKDEIPKDHIYHW